MNVGAIKWSWMGKEVRQRYFVSILFKYILRMAQVTAEIKTGDWNTDNLRCIADINSLTEC